MKALLSMFLVAVVSAQLTHAQTIESLSFPITGTGPIRQQDISVPVGQVFELLTWAASYNGPTELQVDGISVGITVANPANSANTPPVLSPSFVVAGPRTVSVVVPNNASLVCSYRLKTNGEVATQNVATQVVVIPQNATAPADIILESSTDLITWTAALPGSYSPAGSNRFFRVRLVTH